VIKGRSLRGQVPAASSPLCPSPSPGRRRDDLHCATRRRFAPAVDAASRRTRRSRPTPPPTIYGGRGGDRGAGWARIDQLDSDRLLHLMPDYEDRIRQVIDDGGLRKRPHPTRVWMSDRSCRKKHFMTMAGRLTTMEVERDTRLPSIGRRSLCTSEWYTRSATPQGGTA
jgi:hypothetical protein